MTHDRTADHELAARCLRLNPAWRLSRFQGRLILHGDGRMPATWARTVDAIAWIERREKARADQEALDAIRRTTNDEG
jgi:hypothetical protein